MIAAGSSLARGLAAHDIILHRTHLVSTCRSDCGCYSRRILDTWKEGKPVCHGRRFQASAQPVFFVWRPSMSIVKSIVGVLLLLFLISFVLIVPAIVTGSLLRLVFPSVDRGMSILIGLVAMVSSVHLMIRFTTDPPPIRLDGGDRGLDVDDDGDEDEDDLDEDQEDEASRAPHRPPTWALPTPERPSWKRRRRRR
jgi:hypothetical protein